MSPLVIATAGIIPEKGIKFDIVKSNFKVYKAWENHPSLKLFRTCKKDWAKPSDEPNENILAK
jgi:hypothetical protein